MNYWLTTQWPLEASKSEHSGVYLSDGRQKAGEDLRAGDLIFIYESKKCRKEIRKDAAGNDYPVKRQKGKEGVVTLVEAITPILEDLQEIERTYADGTKLWWKWRADTKTIRNTGYVYRKELNRILNFKLGSTLRAIGEKKSGLKKLDEGQFNAIYEHFNNAVQQPFQSGGRSAHIINKAKWSKSPESAAHKYLKEFVAKDPSCVLNEPGLETIKIEYDDFDSGDSADILMKDRFGRIIGVEIELSVGMNDISGVLQAIKYRFMGAVMYGLSFNDTRSFLVAHKISKEVKDLCEKYEVQCFEISSDELTETA